MRIPLLQAASLSSRDGIRHAFFTRSGGVSEGVYASLNGGVGSRDVAERVTENRRRMAQTLAIAAGDLLTAYQIHSPHVFVVERPWSASERPRADALVTTVPMLALGITTADCGPVLFADPQAGVIGAAHAGWRGALAGVLEATVEAMERLGAVRSRIAAALGPTIRQANYEVGQDLIEQFLSANRDNHRFFANTERPGHALFDLPGYIVSRLERAGLGAVEDIGCCTYADPDRFYSYRRTTHRGEADYGRHISAIVL